jgi:hypothetical protein
MSNDSPEGTRIGRYRLVELIGEGGMGEVWRAEQVEPVKRLVALKIIKLGMDTKQVVARFESERQALAVLDHPGIAKLYDAGATETGRPYFVMELVQGLSITDHCDTHHLSTRARVLLFVNVCKAVHHAHTRGLIHRDIKPSNLMVTISDDEPMVKVIDFGIAKAVQKLTDQTLHTQIGQAVGTPAYMSPEQADSDGSGLDARSDVYGLGVVLYELLVGARPYELRQGLQLGLGERLRSTPTPSPSARLESMETSGGVARLRGTTPQDLKRDLEAGLDHVVMKALQPDRTQRFGTALEMAKELERWLRGEEPALPRRERRRASPGARRYGLGAVGLLALGAVVALAAMNGRLPWIGGSPGASSGPSAPVTFADRGISDSERLYFHSLSAIRDASRVVVRDAAQFKLLWELATGQEPGAPPPPPIDFSSDMVLVAAAGLVREGDRIRVDSVRHVAEDLDGEPDAVGQLHVIVRELQGCANPESIGSPVEFVRLPRFDGPVLFLERRQRDPACSVMMMGRITDLSSGEPVARARVLVAEANSGGVTNGSGRFIVMIEGAALARDSLEIRVEAEGYETESLRRAVSGADQIVADVALRRTGGG